MASNLNEVIREINRTTDQITVGSSQSFSQWPTEQASSLEEVSASINEINAQSTKNAESADEANSLAKKASEDAGKGNQQMADDSIKNIESGNKAVEQTASQLEAIMGGALKGWIGHKPCGSCCRNWTGWWGLRQILEKITNTISPWIYLREIFI